MLLRGAAPYHPAGPFLGCGPRKRPSSPFKFLGRARKALRGSTAAAPWLPSAGRPGRPVGPRGRAPADEEEDDEEDEGMFTMPKLEFLEAEQKLSESARKGFELVGDEFKL